MRQVFRSEAGWTITELMFTLTILGFLLTIAVPALSSIGEHIEKGLFLHFLSTDIELAQMEAISRQEEVAVLIKSQVVEVIQTNHVVRRVMIPKRYILKSNYNGGCILFRKTGQVQGGTVWLYKGEEQVGLIKIQVASGRPKVELS